MRKDLLLHSFACAAALCICLMYPASGRDILLVPFSSHSAAVVVNSPGFGGIAMLGGGSIPGSLRVRFAGAPPMLSLLRAGVMPVAVPAFLCSSGQSPA